MAFGKQAVANSPPSDWERSPPAWQRSPSFTSGRPVNSHHFVVRLTILRSISRSHHQSTNSHYRIASDNEKLEVGGLKFGGKALSNIRVSVRQNLAALVPPICRTKFLAKLSGYMHMFYIYGTAH